MAIAGMDDCLGSDPLQSTLPSCPSHFSVSLFPKIASVGPYGGTITVHLYKSAAYERVHIL